MRSSLLLALAKIYQRSNIDLTPLLKILKSGWEEYRHCNTRVTNELKYTGGKYDGPF